MTEELSMPAFDGEDMMPAEDPSAIIQRMTERAAALPPSDWTPLPPVKPHVGCGTCHSAEVVAPLDMEIAVGFGSATLTADGHAVFDEQHDGVHFVPDVDDAEQIAVLNPRHDWRITINGPLRDVEYQRQGPGRWVCVKTGLGFA